MKLPEGHCQIWAIGDTIWLNLPSSAGSHAVPLPNTLEGLVQLQRILVARERSTEARKIGNDGAPTRWQIEAVLQRRERFRAEREARAERQTSRPKRESKPSKVSAQEIESATDVLKELGLL